jgi:all-trans-retinol 13,14-reductase
MMRGLRAKTPVPGLLLTGQDVVTPGVTGAMMGGILTAAAIERRVYPHLFQPFAARCGMRK